MQADSLLSKKLGKPILGRRCASKASGVLQPQAVHWGGSGQVPRMTGPVAPRGLQSPREWMWGPWEHRVEEASHELRLKRVRCQEKREGCSQEWGQTAGSCCMARVCPDVARVMRDTQRLHHPLDSSQRVPPSALHPTSGCQHPEASSPPAQPPSHHVSASYRILQGQHHPNTRIRQRCHREGNYRSISLMIIDVKA